MTAVQYVHITQARGHMSETVAPRLHVIFLSIICRCSSL